MPKASLINFMEFLGRPSSCMLLKAFDLLETEKPFKTPMLASHRQKSLSFLGQQNFGTQLTTKLLQTLLTQCLELIYRHGFKRLV